MMWIDRLTTPLLKRTPSHSEGDGAALNVDTPSGPGAIMFEPGPHTRIRRAPVRAIATLTWTGGPRETFGQVLNLSPGGCLLKTESTIEPGTQVHMNIVIVGHKQRTNAHLVGAVRRETTHDGRRAYGVEFVAECAQDKETQQWLYRYAMNI